LVIIIVWIIIRFMMVRRSHLCSNITVLVPISQNKNKLWEAKALSGLASQFRGHKCRLYLSFRIQFRNWIKSLNKISGWIGGRRVREMSYQAGKKSVWSLILACQLRGRAEALLKQLIEHCCFRFLMIDLDGNRRMIEINQIIE